MLVCAAAEPVIKKGMYTQQYWNSSIVVNERRNEFSPLLYVLSSKKSEEMGFKGNLLNFEIIY